MPPRVTVIMATYNRGRHILPSVESVLDQEFRKFELLVVGDACTDDTAEVLKPYLSDRVRWHNLPKRWRTQSGPNNWGATQASGDIIAYIGHDDIWAPDHLARHIDLYDDPDVDVAVSGMAAHRPDGAGAVWIMGIFDDPDAAATHFFPPSSMSHRASVLARTGPWREGGSANK